MLVAGVLAWLEYGASFRDAHDRVWRAADAVQQYTLKVFETDELIMGQISEHVAGQDWSELVRSVDFHRYIQQFGRPQVSSVGLISRDRGLAATNPIFPAPAVAVEPPEYLPVEQPGSAPIYIGTAVQGSITRAAQFSIVRPEGDGLIFVSLRVTDFTEYYRSIVDLSDFTVTVARTDGAVLARSPGESRIGSVLSAGSGFRQAIDRTPHAGIYET